MRRRVVRLWGALGVLALLCLPLQAAVWQKQDVSVNEQDFYHIILTDDQSLLLASEKNVYRYNIEKSQPQVIYSLPLKDESINALLADDAYLYIATTNGVVRLDSAADQSSKIFNPLLPADKNCLALLTLNHSLWIGTDQGLWKQSPSDGFVRVDGFANFGFIDQIQSGDGVLFLSSSKGLLRYDLTTKEIKNIFQNFKRDQIDESLDESVDRHQRGFIKALAINPLDSSHIVVATSYGIYESFNAGDDFNKMATESIVFEDVLQLRFLKYPFESTAEFFSPRASLVVSTSKGAYLLNGTSAFPIYRGLPTSVIRAMVQTRSNVLMAVTDQGVFDFDLVTFFTEAMSEEFFFTDKQALFSAPSYPVPDIFIDTEKIKRAFSKEPTIGEVHQMAIDYAQVSNQKISQWQKQARKQAWVPDLDIGFDGAHDWGASDSVYGSSSGSHYIAPDDKSWGRDFGWDVNLSWDLGDVIWSSDQTSIDSRAKLMVELRDDILNQVTRLYFERRRLQAEMMDQPENTIGTFQKQMRVEELTALIDGLTGGGFSLSWQKE